MFLNSTDSLFACTMYNRKIISSFLGLEGPTTFIEYLIKTLSNSFIIDSTVDSQFLKPFREKQMV